jgi:hypothetical protein
MTSAVSNRTEGQVEMTEPTMAPAPASLAGKLIEVMESVGHLEKRGRNDFHKYNYVTEADVVQALRSELAKRKILLFPAAPQSRREPAGESFLTTVEMTLTFMDAETGEKLSAHWYGTGQDKGDKGLYKAYTGGIKYFLMKTFLIPTGDDPEGDTSVDASAAPRRAENGSQALPRTYPDALRLAIRHKDPTELADDDEFARLVGTATTPEERNAVIAELEAALLNLDGDPKLVRERFEALTGVAS